MTRDDQASPPYPSLYYGLLGFLRDLVWRLDIDGTVRFASAPAERLLAYSPEEMVGRPIDAFLTEESAERVHALLAQHAAPSALESGKLEGVEYRRREGATFRGPFFSMSVRNEDGGLEEVQALTRAEIDGGAEALVDAQERYTMAIRAGKVGVWDCRFDNNQFWSHELEALLGFGPGEVGPKMGRWLKLVPEEDRALMMETIQAYIRGELPQYECEHRMYRKDGTLGWYLCTGCLVEWAGGAPVRLVGTTVDVTERRQAEEERKAFEAQMRHAQKLESLGVLAGGIAHDFNNLLMAILGNAELALMDVSASSPAVPSLEEIRDVACAAAELCKQMLAYAGKGRVELKTIDLSEMVEEMSHMLEVSISKKATLRRDFDLDMPGIEGDPAQIRQVIMNLITNASEALGDAPGAIAVSTGVAECDRDFLNGLYVHEALAEGRYCYLEVSDTGCGMDAQTQEKIFDPFFTTKFVGRGLGLAAVLGIVRGHNGTLKVESEPGRGTTVTVYFPAVDAAVDGCEESAEEAQAGWRGDGLVLLVDDEEHVRKVGARILDRMGFVVLEASNGTQALDIFREHADEIVCVLLDLTMPEIDGEEVFQELRKIRPEVCVVLASGYSEQEVAERFPGSKPAAFIEKPYQLDRLRDILAELLPARDH